MSKEKIIALIDKVIGKKGPLRIPAYWMREVLNKMTDWTSKVEGDVANVDSKVEDTRKAIPTKVSQLENDSEYATTNMVQQYEYSNYNSIFTVSPTNPIFILDVMPNHYRNWNPSIVGPQESYIYTFLNKSSSLGSLLTSHVIHIKEGNPFGLYKLSFVALESNESYPEVYVNEIPQLKGYAYCTFDYKKEDGYIYTGSGDKSRIFYNGSYAGGHFYPDTINGEEGEYSFLYIIKEIDTNKHGKGSIIYSGTIGNKVKKIELCNASILYGQTFANKPLLEEIVFPTTLRNIPSSAFEGCTSLKELVFNIAIKY